MGVEAVTLIRCGIREERLQEILQRHETDSL